LKKHTHKPGNKYVLCKQSLLSFYIESSSIKNANSHTQLRTNTHPLHSRGPNVTIQIECARVFASEIGAPIIGFNVYNPDKKVITEFSKNELQILANVMWFANNMTTGLFVMITISQIDIALLRIVYSEAMSIITIRMLLNEKEFPGCKLDHDENNDKINLNS